MRHCVKTFAFTHTGLTRNKNEDRYLIKEITDDSVLLAVADGMRGEVAGDYPLFVGIALWLDHS